MKTRKIIIITVSIVLTLCIATYFILDNTIFFQKLKQDLSGTPPVNSEKEIDKILNGFERVSLSALPKEFLESGDFLKPQFQSHFQGRFFYKIKFPQAMQKIVGDWRIIDFMSADQKTSLFYYFDDEFYWLTDKKVLHAFLQLKKKMEEKNLDWKAISVSSGHRSPYINNKVKGATLSRHICGEAIDFSVGDADKNGVVNYEDKLRVLELCETIIGNRGGIGLYPKTQAVHIDTRGQYARWNSY